MKIVISSSISEKKSQDLQHSAKAVLKTGLLSVADRPTTSDQTWGELE